MIEAGEKLELYFPDESLTEKILLIQISRGFIASYVHTYERTDRTKNGLISGR